MDREVEDILQDTDGGETDEEEEPVGFPRKEESEENRGSNHFIKEKNVQLNLFRISAFKAVEFDDDAPPSRKRKLEMADHHLIIGAVIDQDSPENDTLMTRFRRGEDIPVLDGDEPDDEDSNEPEIDDLESDEEAEDSELCLAGQALEREFLSEED